MIDLSNTAELNEKNLDIFYVHTLNNLDKLNIKDREFFCCYHNLKNNQKPTYEEISEITGFTIEEVKQIIDSEKT